MPDLPITLNVKTEIVVKPGGASEWTFIVYIQGDD